MKVRLIIIGLTTASIVLALYLVSSFQTVYGLRDTNLELVFVVTDAATGQPIPNASIDLMFEEYEKAQEQKLVKLMTDREGKARFVHENNSCEDVIRPWRETVTLIDLTWASV